MPWRSLRAAAALAIRQGATLTVEGSGHLPPVGPAVIAARHYHHLYDGCALLRTIPRPTHVVVALDWVQNPASRQALAFLCRAARWPTVIRPDPAGGRPPRAALAMLRQAMQESLVLLGEGRVLVLFPEGYPNIDPGWTPKASDEEFLPFQHGYLRIARIASQRLDRPVPIIPTGLTYHQRDRWDITLRFGPPRYVTSRASEAFVAVQLEQDVLALSGSR